MAHVSDRVLERLSRLHPKKIDLSLDRMTRLLARLGHPEQHLPPVIHIAGTNGKGSTTAFLRAMLEAAGLKVHVYSSPHLVRFCERIRLAGRLIDEDRMLTYLLDCERINGDSPITYFEITTAMAFRAFADCPADVVLLEVGLGGRLDATNVIARPLSTVITPIARDHEQFLGSDLGGIAREKAGIARTDTPLVFAPQAPVVEAALLDQARMVGAIPITGDVWTMQPTDAGFDYHDAQGTLSCPRPRLSGQHQKNNAALAVACLRHQDHFTLTSAHMAQGLSQVTWPARLQDISNSPYGRRLPPGSRIWLDGGHNPAAGQVLAAHMAQLVKDRPLYLICGMMAGKGVAGFLKNFTAPIRMLYGVPISGQDSYSGAQIAQIAAAENIPAQAAVSPEAALDQIAARADMTPVQLLICGSLYLAGSVLTENNLQPL